MNALLAAATLVATHLTAFPIPAPVDATVAERVRTECELTESASLLDATMIPTAEEIADRIGPDLPKPTILYGAKLAGQDVIGLLKKLDGGCVHSSDLSASNASGTSLRNATLVFSVIEGADWSKSDLSGTRFVGINANKANFARAKMDGGAWVGAFGRSWLLDSDFTDASLRGFVFVCGLPEEFDCRGEGRGKFDGADFTKADLGEYGFMGWRSFKGARIDRTRIDPSHVRWLEDVDLGSAIILASGSARDAGPSVSLTRSEFRKLQRDTLSLSNDDPSFDCKKAANYAELNICGEWGNLLRAYDRELAEIVRFARKRRVGGIDQDQRQWRARRDRCEEVICIYRSYQDRLTEVYAALGTRVDLPAGESLRFHQRVIRLKDATRKTRLYKRMLPVLRDASEQTVILTGLRNGDIRVEGEAIGLHGQVCRWKADTRYDAASGWYVGQTKAGTWVPTFRVWNGELTPSSGGYSGVEKPVDDEFFEGCEAFAAFAKLRLLGED